MTTKNIEAKTDSKKTKKRPSSGHVVSTGSSRLLGSTIQKDGVNFSIWCPDANEMDLLLFKSVDDDSPEIISLNADVFKSNYYWHVKVHGIGAGQIYAWMIRGSTHGISDRKDTNIAIDTVLLDPYSFRVLFPKDYKRFQGKDIKENFRCSAKSAVIDFSTYNWDMDFHPKTPLARTVIYEMHVKGFTMDPSSGLDPKIRGTYRGLIEKIPYLKKLGITAIELLPVYQFDEQDAMPGKKNYWGYCPMSFFALHEAYSSDRSLMGPINEFRDMVKALHRNGIEVFLDVVYNHTSEGDFGGPTYCFKGLDRRSYYITNQDGSFANYSGCGNTINANEPVVRTLILHSLIFWKELMHVDGFRFDLASILSRDASGAPLAGSSTLRDIDSNAHLADTKIIAEPWDAGGLYQLGSISGSKWREWNGKFRDDVRSFIRGDTGVIKNFISRMLGSPDIYSSKQVDPQKSINFITCHDGFTLWDLVSYDHKHNEDNGENNRDGTDANYSANYGYEGPLDDPQLNRLRLRQVKNMMTLTLLAMGTPMIYMGDEILRTQKGNNNAYCQDNELSWMNWKLSPAQKEMLDFTTLLIKIRSHGKFLSHVTNNKQINSIASNTGLMRALRRSKLQWHGTLPFQPDWSDISHSIGFTVYYGRYGCYAYVFVNAFWEDLEIELPPPPVAAKNIWYKFIDTSQDAMSNIKIAEGKRYYAGDKLEVQARSVVMFLTLED